MVGSPTTIFGWLRWTDRDRVFTNKMGIWWTRIVRRCSGWCLPHLLIIKPPGFQLLYELGGCFTPNENQKLKPELKSSHFHVCTCTVFWWKYVLLQSWINVKTRWVGLKKRGSSGAALQNEVKESKTWDGPPQSNLHCSWTNNKSLRSEQKHRRISLPSVHIIQFSMGPPESQ